jgi:hypothetical protein
MPIYCSGTNPTQRQAVQYLRADHVDALVAAADALADWVEGIIEDGCPLCGGDCSSSNPPPTYCPQKDAMRDLAAYNEAKKGGA